MASSIRESDTTTLASDISKYRFEHGRRYHAYRDGAYWGPNDEKHNNHLDIAYVTGSLICVGSPAENLHRHHLWLKALENKLYLAPIGEKPQVRGHVLGFPTFCQLTPFWNLKRILDLGTGTGIWAMRVIFDPYVLRIMTLMHLNSDIADQFPSAEVIGTDLSPTQPGLVPPNIRFEIDDFESPWTYKRNAFDFIHARTLLGCVADWPNFYKQALR